MSEIFAGRDGLYYFRVKATNGQILCHSEGYASRQMAEHGLGALIKVIKDRL